MMGQNAQAQGNGGPQLTEQATMPLGQTTNQNSLKAQNPNMLQSSDDYLNVNGTSSPKHYKNQFLSQNQKQSLTNIKQKKIERLKTEEDENVNQTNSYFSSVQRIKTEANRKQRTLFKIQRNYSKNQLQ